MIHVGDCLEVMRTLEANIFDSIVTDPPYHLTTGKKGGTGPATLNPNSPAGRSRIGTGFMGKAWDGGDIAFRPETWAEALRVAKPGAYLAAFGGTRTFHRLACAIEDAGWELRDTLMWLYGSGFPKSHNGEWGGTALKPAWEPIILARKPLIGTVEANWREHGTGALNIDGCRVETDEVGVPREKDPARMTMPDWRMSGGSTGSGASNPLGRWPANLIHDGSEEVLACFPDAPGQVAKASTSTSTRKNQNTYGSLARGSGGNEPRDDAGSAARFFYCAKASKADRDEGCEGIELRPSYMVENGSKTAAAANGVRYDRTTMQRNNHPTVKPTELMRWLCRLVTPRGGLVLDPFAGSGSTGRGAIAEGMRFTGIELDPEYAAIAEARIRAMQPGLGL